MMQLAIKTRHWPGSW